MSSRHYFESFFSKKLKSVVLAVCLHGVAVDVSAQLPELPSPAALSGDSTTARFFGGASVNEGASFLTSVAGHQPVDVHLEIQVESNHINTLGNLYLIVDRNGSLFMRDESGTFYPWDGGIASLLPTSSNKSLAPIEQLTVLDDVALGDQGIVGETIKIFIAYDTVAEANELFYSGSPFSLSVVPTDIAYNGWSTMNNTLGGQNTGSSLDPRPVHDPSLYTMVGEMYLANGINGYSFDFQFLPQGSEYIDGSTAMENIYSTTSSVAVISAYGGLSGIIQDPESANGANGWIDRMVNIAQAAEQQNITPIMFQAWGSGRFSADFVNARINSDALEEKYDMLIVRTAEIVDALGKLNPAYITNSESPGGKFAAPVLHLYSGSYQDEFHGSYAMAYANALATFKALTGISAAENKFVIPSGGEVGSQYGMPSSFIYDIISTVDAIQRESLISR